MLNEIIMLLVSLTGLLFGLILARIAPEELDPGKKYFFLMNEILFYGILLFSMFLFYLENYYWTFLPIIYLVLYFIVIRKQKRLLKEIMNYSFFIIVYVLLIINLKNNLLIILPSLIFIYGLPVGTLFKCQTKKIKD